MPALASLLAVLLAVTTAVTGARGNPHDAAYDSLGQMISLETRDTGLTEYRFTVAGDLGARITPNLARIGTIAPADPNGRVTPAQHNRGGFEEVSR